jgi:hypothetical protein
MKIKHFLIVLLLLSATALRAETIEISASESDAKIIVDGKHVGTGSAKVSIPKNGCVNVKIQKVGFLKYEQTFCRQKNGIELQKKNFFDMKRDDAEEASIKTDQANIDFSVEVNPNLELTEAWKLVTQIVTDYFDAIEVSDKETSYLRTAWSVQTFQQNTVRTRLIIKLSKSSPLTYKVKLVSEHSGDQGSSVKSDEQFRDWDRILRKYQNVISDFSNRLGNK